MLSVEGFGYKRAKVTKLMWGVGEPRSPCSLVSKTEQLGEEFLELKLEYQGKGGEEILMMKLNTLVEGRAQKKKNSMKKKIKHHGDPSFIQKFQEVLMVPDYDAML